MYWFYVVGRVLGFIFGGMWLFLGPFAQAGLVRQRGPVDVMTYQATADGLTAALIGMLFGLAGVVWLYVVRDRVRYRALIDLWLPSACGIVACLIVAGIEPALYALVLGVCVPGLACGLLRNPMQAHWPY